MASSASPDVNPSAAGAALAYARCVLCGAERTKASETALVRCNIRAFEDERFEVWRCGQCRSIHAGAPVDLEHYYSRYPLFTAELNWMLEVVYSNLLARLRRAGLQPGQSVLDYGCGNGVLVKFLRKRGYPAEGYDRYNPAFSDPSVLERRYDCVVSQDVIEHVDDPHALLAEFDRLTVPGALISVGTPDADALSLTDSDDFRHALHAPYHRHILSTAALQAAGERRGWRPVRYYDTMYNNTLFPTMNPRFALHYVRSHDDVFDLVAEPIKLSWKLISPVTLLFALFGFFFDRHTDIQMLWRKPDAARLIS